MHGPAKESLAKMDKSKFLQPWRPHYNNTRVISRSVSRAQIAKRAQSARRRRRRLKNSGPKLKPMTARDDNRQTLMPLPPKPISKRPILDDNADILIMQRPEPAPLQWDSDEDEIDYAIRKVTESTEDGIRPKLSSRSHFYGRFQRQDTWRRNSIARSTSPHSNHIEKCIDLDLVRFIS